MAKRTVDLKDDELVLLIQLVNQRMVQVARDQVANGKTQCQVSTPLEEHLLKKLVKVDQEAVAAENAVRR